MIEITMFFVEFSLNRMQEYYSDVFVCDTVSAIDTCTAQQPTWDLGKRGCRSVHPLYVYFPCPLLNTLRPKRNEQHFADDIFKRIFIHENVWVPIKISWKFVPNGPVNNIPAMFQIMAWRRPGDKPLSEPMMVSLPTHLCVARPQWVIYIYDCVSLRSLLGVPHTQPVSPNQCLLLRRRRRATPHFFSTSCYLIRMT